MFHTCAQNLLKDCIHTQHVFWNSIKQKFQKPRRKIKQRLKWRWQYRQRMKLRKVCIGVHWSALVCNMFSLPADRNDWWLVLSPTSVNPTSVIRISQIMSCMRLPLNLSADHKKVLFGLGLVFVDNSVIRWLCWFWRVAWFSIVSV